MVLPGPFRAAIIHRPGHPAFFRCGRQQTEKNRNDREMRAQTRISRGGDDPFNEGVVSRKVRGESIALEH